MKVVLASHNKKKMVEMKTILSAMGVEVLSQADVGVDLEPEETGTTFAENAAIKAQAVMEATGLPAHCGRLRADGGRPERRAGGILRPVRRPWAG